MKRHWMRLGGDRGGEHLTTIRDEGVGQACVLVHGSPLDQGSWDGLVPLLVGGRRVVSYDLRGHGSAAGAPSVRSMSDYADDLAELLDLLGITRPHLVGHSFGGQVAQCFAVRFPGRARRLTLLCTRATPYPPFAEAARLLEESGRTEAAPVIARWFSPEAITAGAPSVRYAESCLAAADPAVWATTLRMIAAFDGLDELHRVTAPVRVVGAEHDQVATPEAATRMALAFPHGRLHLLQGAYHCAPLLDPGPVAALIRDDD